MTKQVKSDVESFARIRVIGVGGSGTNTVDHMVNSRVQGVDFIVANTDAQDLHKSKARKKIHIGKTLTRGLGTGMNPELGKQAAEETREEIQEALKGSDMVFVTCGMGGGTGTGAAPVIAKLARELGALTVGVVTRPFAFEGAQRARLAEQGLSEFRKSVDALITVPNDRLLAIVSRDTGLRNAFAMSDDVLRQAVEGISDLITTTGIINVDFADVRAVMHNAGSALMGIGIGMGEKRAEAAARAAINSPLLEVSINGAKGVLFSVAGGDDLGMLEIQDAANVITEAIDPDAKVIFGAVVDESLKKGQVRVTVVATGFPEPMAKPVTAGTTTPSFTGKISTTPVKDQDVPPASLRQREGHNRREDAKRVDIHAQPQPVVASTPAPQPEEVRRERPVLIRDTPKEPLSVPPQNADIIESGATSDDDDVWGGLPSFLRRRS